MTSDFISKTFLIKYKLECIKIYDEMYKSSNKIKC